ncbi:MAG: hypothetical protein AAEI08_07440, partial [Gammaproteobacteria bacterium]
MKFGGKEKTMKKARFGKGFFRVIFILSAIALQACGQNGGEITSNVALGSSEGSVVDGISVIGEQVPGTGFAAIPGQKGGQD